MLFETLTCILDTLSETTAILFNQTNPNVQECAQPENKSKNKKPPACIYFLKKVSENLITFFLASVLLSYFFLASVLLSYFTWI